MPDSDPATDTHFGRTGIRIAAGGPESSLKDENRNNRYVVGRLMTAGTEAFVSVFIGSGATQIDVIEPKPMEAALVTVDAAALAAGIDAEGHIAIYAILFETGQSTLKPESKAAISEIAKLLKNRMELKLFVVSPCSSPNILAIRFREGY